ncbi:hypothetical protein ACWGTO_09925 [Mesorhizobium sp. PL10]
MGEVTSNSNEGEGLWVFDLVALREAFRKSVSENKITAAEWGQHAAQFLEMQRNRQREPHDWPG